MMLRPFNLLVLMCTLLVAGCGSMMKDKPGANAPMHEGRCLALADSLRTLRVGDPLPRVEEVLGSPDRRYRTITTFGGKFDVLEYDTGLGPCAMHMLQAPRKLTVLFDKKGQLVGYGRSRFTPIQGATSVRVTGGTGGRF